MVLLAVKVSVSGCTMAVALLPAWATPLAVQVVPVETLLEPGELLRGLLRIELEMGRRRDLVVAKGPRVIDLDLLLVDDFVVATKELTLPHPAMAERRFVLEPLAEIAAEMVDPVSGRTVAEMLAGLE